MKKSVFVVIGIVLFIGLLVALYFFNNALKVDQEEKLSVLHKCLPDAQSKLIDSHDGQLHYVHSGNPTGIPVVLIHGSPGSWSDWLELFCDKKSNTRFSFFAVDRPGFGMTTLSSMPYVEQQADAIIPLIQKINKPVVLIGHSYGGAVIQEIALKYPQLVSHVIHVASTLEPEAQDPKWYNRLANSRIVSWMLADYWQASSKEMSVLSEALQQHEDNLTSMEMPIYMIQGKKDILVPFSVVKYYQSKTENVEFIIDEKENHFIPWTKPKLILDILEKISSG